MVPVCVVGTALAFGPNFEDIRTRVRMHPGASQSGAKVEVTLVQDKTLAELELMMDDWGVLCVGAETRQ